MKTQYIYIGIVVSVIVMLIAWCVSVNNTAIGYDENIGESKAGITVQQRRQHDLILQLVQVVEENSKFEKETQTDIAKLRSSVASAKTVEQAQLEIQAVAEAYPQLQASQAYTQLMTEMSVSQNLVSQYQITYNQDVKNYRRFVRRFPNRMFLAIGGYEIENYEYLTLEEIPLSGDLFGD